MAELKCKDGTVVKISDETEQELRRAFSSKKETYRVGDFVWRDKEGIFAGNHIFQIIQNDRGEVGLNNILDSCPNRILLDYYRVSHRDRITQAELNCMTLYPEGLRKISPSNIKVTVTGGI